MRANKWLASLGAVACVAVAGAGVAVAQQLDPGISCIDGSVSSMDWSELESRYKESIWDTKAAVRLQSQDTELELKVTDSFGNSVCEDTADLKVRCKFNFPASYAGTFNIRVDNFQTTTSRYKLCAE